MWHYVHTFVPVPTGMFVCPSICLSVYLHVFLSVNTFIHPKYALPYILTIQLSQVCMDLPVFA